MIAGRIEGLSHITLITRDLERMSAIMEQVLDGEEVYSSGDDTFSLSREKFFIVGGQWIAITIGRRQSYDHLTKLLRNGRVRHWNMGFAKPHAGIIRVKTPTRYLHQVLADP